MTNLISISSYNAARVRIVSRVVHLVIGVGLPSMLVAYPPVKPAWITMGSVLSIILFTFALIGLWPRLRVSILGHVVNNRVVHATVYLALGLSVILMTVYNPPVSAAWYGFFVVVGALLVIDAIVTVGHLMKSSARRGAKPLDIHHRPRKTA